MIQMCYKALIIARFENLNGLKYIDMMAKMKITANKAAVVQTIV